MANEITAKITLIQNIVTAAVTTNQSAVVGNITFGGPPGLAATIAIGTVTSGSSPAVENVGTAWAAILNFVFQKGDDGSPATVAVGTVTTGAAGSSATVTNSGSSSAAVFNFTIPKGDKGDPGPGVPTGGTTAQVLAKIDGTDYRTHWITLGTAASHAATDFDAAGAAQAAATEAYNAAVSTAASQAQSYANTAQYNAEVTAAGDATTKANAAQSAAISAAAIDATSKANASLSSANSYTDNAVTGVLDDRGLWDASGNAYPTTGGTGTGGAVKKGNLWTISGLGTLGGNVVADGDWIRALADNPGQDDSKWAVSEGNLPYTTENSSNKTQTLLEDAASTTKYPSAKAVMDASSTGGNGNDDSGKLAAYGNSGQLTAIGFVSSNGAVTVTGNTLGVTVAPAIGSPYNCSWPASGGTFALASQIPTGGTGPDNYCVGNDGRLSDSRTPTSHYHGNLTNDGKIGSTANLPLITTTGGAVTVGSFGTAANTFCQGNDARLSDARTPSSTLAHAASHAPGASDALFGTVGASIAAAATQANARNAIGLDTANDVEFHSLSLYGNVLYPCSISCDGAGTILLNSSTSNGANVYGTLLCRGTIATTMQLLSGAGAVNVTTVTTMLTTTGSAQGLTLANGGSDAQIKIIVHRVAGGTAVLTPTTKTGYSKITFNSAGDSVTLMYVTTQGWIVLASRGVTIA